MHHQKAYILTLKQSDTNPTHDYENGNGEEGDTTEVHRLFITIRSLSD